MRKLIMAAAAVALLGGCAQLKSMETALQLGTASIANPVTLDRLNQMESATILVFAGLKTWKTTCVQGLIPPACKQQIASVQVYTRQIPPYLAKLRTFVKTNDQVNATMVFNSIVDLISTVKTQAAAGGIAIASTPGA